MARKSSGLASWLAGQSHETLLALLRARPDAALPPEPDTPDDLAGRLSTVHSVRRAAQHLGLPELQAVEALLALGGRATRAELADLLDAADEVEGARLDAALAGLGRLALLWIVGDELRLVDALRELIPQPLALGGAGRQLFEQLTAAQLGRIGSELGLGGYTRKAQWIDAIVECVGDPSAVAARLATGPPDLAEAVREIAWHGPRAAGVRLPSPYERTDPKDLGVRLAMQGWMVPTQQWGAIGEMPREVALAVRGTEYHAPFDPPPPAPTTAAVDPNRLQEGSRHAAGAAVDAVRRLVALLERSPATTLQAGGVGVRELRRLAKLLSTDEAAVRLWLEVAAATELVTVADGGDHVLPTEMADAWLEADPAHALATLLVTWWTLAIVPGDRVDDTGKPAPALAWVTALPGAELLRADLLGELATLAPDGPGRGLADGTDGTPLARLLAHRRPVVSGAPQTLLPRVRATLAEATLLGLVADGALTALGFALLDAVDTTDPGASVAAAAAGLLPAPTATATFLPDLTAVVGGAVSASLSRLLDEAADAETRDTASTWRFSTASVRRCFDGGGDAATLLAALGAVADNPLPQPLEYLIRDVARRHGELEVVPAACCVVVADPALAAEVAAHRRLASLTLRRIGGSVLASGKPARDTMTALRAAGYAPVRRDAGGATVIDKVPSRRVDRRSSPRTGSTPGGPPPPDLPALARRLARGGDRASGGPAEPTPVIREGPRIGPDEAPRLSPAEVTALDHAIRHGSPVEIDYVNADGGRSSRVIEPVMRLGGTLVAFCRLRQAERNFALARITAASPVPE